MAMTPETQSPPDAGSADSVAPLARRFLWTDTASGVNRLIIGLAVLCLVLFAVDLVHHRHTKVPGEEFTGFHAIAGFVSFTVIVVGARLLRVLIRRDESFYAPYGVDAEEYPEAGTQRLNHEQRPADSLHTLRDELLGRTSQPVSENADNGRGVS